MISFHFCFNIVINICLFLVTPLILDFVVFKVPQHLNFVLKDPLLFFLLFKTVFLVEIYDLLSLSLFNIKVLKMEYQSWYFALYMRFPYLTKYPPIYLANNYSSFIVYKDIMWLYQKNLLWRKCLVYVSICSTFIFWLKVWQMAKWVVSKSKRYCNFRWMSLFYHITVFICDI